MRKHLLLIVFALFCFQVKAQIYERITTTDEQAAKTLSETMLQNASREYGFVESYLGQNSRTLIIDFAETVDEGQPARKLRVTFQIYMVGANPAMEIEGTPLYQLNSIDGAYLDVFPIWKEYFNSEAEAEPLSQKTSGESKHFEKPDGSKAIYKFAPNKQVSGNWTLKRTF